MPAIRLIRGIARALDYVEALHFASKLLRKNYFRKASGLIHGPDGLLKDPIIEK